MSKTYLLLERTIKDKDRIDMFRRTSKYGRDMIKYRSNSINDAASPVVAAAAVVEVEAYSSSPQ